MGAYRCRCPLDDEGRLKTGAHDDRCPAGQLQDWAGRAFDARAAAIARMERDGQIVSTCLGCQEFYAAADPLAVFAPRHRASTRCESGGRAHCTCSACW